MNETKIENQPIATTAQTEVAENTSTEPGSEPK